MTIISVLLKDTSTRSIPFSFSLEYQSNMFNDAKSFMEENTCKAEDFNTFSEILSSDNKFIKAYWDGSDETELKIKDETKATIRCILEDVDDNTKKCIYSNKPAKHLVIFAKAY